jgi:hypothetical protein
MTADDNILAHFTDDELLQLVAVILAEPSEPGELFVSPDGMAELEKINSEMQARELARKRWN